MQNYLIIYHAPAEAMAAMATASEEEKMAGMKPWMDWRARCGEAIVDFGAPLLPGQSMDKSGDWSQSSTEVTGYSILKASDLDAAKEYLKGHPHTAWAPGCTIDIHECAKM